MEILSVVLAGLFGVPCWLILVLVVGEGVGPFGGAGPFALPMLAPAAIMAALAKRALDNGEIGNAAWAIAVAPLVVGMLGALEFMLASEIAKRNGLGEGALIGVFVLGTVLWLFLSYRILIAPKAPPAANPDQTQELPTIPDRLDADTLPQDAPLTSSKNDVYGWRTRGD